MEKKIKRKKKTLTTQCKRVVKKRKQINNSIIKKGFLSLSFFLHTLKKSRSKKIKSRNKKKEKSIILPLTFSHGLKLSLVKIRRKFLNARWKYVTAGIVAICLVTSSMFILKNDFIKAATFNFTQSEWTTESTDIATHTSNQTEWNKYASKDDNIVAGDDIALTTEPATSSIDFTTEGNYTQEDSDRTEFESGMAKLKSISNNYFGDGTDGDVTISSDTKLVVQNKNGSYDGDMVVKHYNSLTVNEGMTLTTDQPGRGLLIYVKEDLTVNGAISMTSRGAFVNPTTAGVSATGLRIIREKSGETETLSASDLAGCGTVAITAEANQGAISGNGEIFTIERVGAYANTNGAVGQSGGGGNGSNGYYTYGGIGSAGTCFSGGSSGSGGGLSRYPITINSVPYGGPAGTGGGGFGVGNPSYGTAGLLILIVDGDVTIGNDGVVESYGKNGGVGASMQGGGGGGGGGNILILHSGSLINSGSINVSGGVGGTGHYGSANDGGDGAIQTSSITGNIYSTTPYYITTTDDSQIDSSTWAEINSASITQTTPTNTDVKYLVSFDDRATWKYWDGDSWESSSLDNLQTDGMSTTILEGLSTANWASTGGFIAGTTNTIDFAMDLSTSDETVTPEIDQIEFNYDYYENGSLISSKFNSESDANAMGGIIWDEDSTLPTGTSVTLSLRTAFSAVGLDSASWSEIAVSTPSSLTSGCAKDSSTVTCNSAVIPSAMKDGSDDQYYQYKVELDTTGVNTPIVDNIQPVYVVNAPPSVQTVTASQDSEGTVNISYQIKDIDTTSGSITQNFITPTFQYSLDDGSSWSDIPASSISFGSAPENGEVVDTNSDGDLDNEVLEDSFLTYTATFDASDVILSEYSTQFQIKVTADDNEAVNNTASSTSSSSTLDTTIPTSTSIGIDATVDPAELTLFATDDSSIQMKIGLESDLSGAEWEDYSTSSTIAIVSDPDTVYVKFKDAYNNESNIISVTSPATPSNPIVQDVSNLTVSPEEYALFIVWGVVDEPTHGFSSYKVYHSTDGLSYGLESTIENKAINYYADFGLDESSIHYYKITTEDNDGNVSNYSSVVNGAANGVQDGNEGGGGTESTAPVISSVSSSGITTQSATIIWYTDELSDSRVEYITATGGDFTDAPYIGVASMLNDTSGVGQHSVTLSGLDPDTTYYYRVKSTDVSSNIATDTDGTNGYSFTTDSGPIISNVTEGNIGNTTTNITWTTDTDADSYVVYSTNSDLSSSTEVGTTDTTSNHSVDLLGLTTNTKYYYYVKSNDAEDRNVVEGVIEYYSFTTSSDSSAPEIIFDSSTDITATDTTATINWTTDESATSKVSYGLTANSYTWEEENTNYNVNHSTVLTGLTANTEYFFKLESTDSNSNTRTDNNSGSDYTFTTSAIPDTTGPIISNLTVADTSVTTAQITWTTDEASSSFIQYATSTTNFDDNYIEVGKNDSVTSHIVNASGLLQNQTYYYKVRTVDGDSNQTLDDNSGVYHTFTTLDGPTITSVSSIPGETSATIIWTSNENSNSYVVYDTHSDFSDSQERGVPDKDKTSHSITVTGLATETIYYYKVRSSNIAGGATTQDDSYSFTTTATTSEDTSGPEITEVIVADLTYNSATITWETGEEGNSLVDYGETTSYGESHGDSKTFITSHSVTIPDLNPITKYYYQTKSLDSSGNISTQSVDNNNANLSFTTLSGSVDADDDGEGDQLTDISDDVQGLIDSYDYSEEDIQDSLANLYTITSDGPNAIISNNTTATITWDTSKSSNGKVTYWQDGNNEDTASTMSEEGDTTIEHKVVIKKLNAQTKYKYYVTSITPLGSTITSSTKTFTTGDSPQISSISISDITLESAIIKWTTDSITSSIVEYGTTTKYGEEQRSSSSSDSTDHTVQLEGLSVGETYHLRITGADSDDETVTSDDYTFTTQELPTISDTRAEEVNTEQVTIKWTTNVKTDSLVEYKIKEDEKGASQGVLEAVTDHEVKLEDLMPGATYEIKVSSKDQFGNKSESDSFTFITEEDNNPPTIKAVKSETTIFPSKESKIQTIISWLTDKQSNSILAYKEGTSAKDVDLSEAFKNENISEHEDWKIVRKSDLFFGHMFVITEFKSSTVYTFRVASIDKRGNLSISDNYSLLTPAKDKSIFDLIVKNFEDTFGWLKKVGG